MSTLSVKLQELRENYDKLRSIFLDKNLEKLFLDIRYNNQSKNSVFLTSLTASSILKAISYYGDKEAPMSEFEITDGEKLLLIYCIFHNHAWKSFVRMYHSVERGGTGGANYSQNPLAIEIGTMIRMSKNRKDRTFYEKMYDELEAIRTGLESFEASIKSQIAILEEKKALMEKIDRTRKSEIISRYFVQSVTFERSTVFRFLYKCPVSRLNCLVPTVGASNIDYEPLRQIIAQIFKTPKTVSKKKPIVQTNKIQCNTVPALSKDVFVLKEPSEGSLTGNQTEPDSAFLSAGSAVALNADENGPPTSDLPATIDSARSDAGSGVALNDDGNGGSMGDPIGTVDVARSDVGSDDGNRSSISIPTTCKAVNLSNDLQLGGQQLMDSIFGKDDSDNELDKDSSLIQAVSKPSFFSYQILTGKNAADNGVLIEEEIQFKLDQNYRRAIKDFQLSIETVLRYIEYNQPFKTFFIICESAPYTYYDRLLAIDPSVKSIRPAIIEGSKKYLKHLCLNMFNFLKQLNVYRECDRLDMEILEGFFTEVSVTEKSKFLDTLNKPAVLKSIFSVTREEELLVNISKNSFRNYKFQLIEAISDNVLKNSGKAKDWFASDENIKAILSNIGDFGVTAAKVNSVKSAIKDYVCEENLLPFSDHRYNTRSKEGTAPLVSYFGQDSSVPEYKGKRKRGDEDLPDEGNKRLLKEPPKEIRSPAIVSIKNSSSPTKEPQPEKRFPEIVSNMNLSASPADGDEDVSEEVNKRLLKVPPPVIGSSATVSFTNSSSSKEFIPEKRFPENVSNMKSSVSPADNKNESGSEISEMLKTDDCSTLAVKEKDQPCAQLEATVLNENHFTITKRDDIMEIAIEEQSEWFGLPTVPVQSDNIPDDDNKDIDNNENETSKSMEVDSPDRNVSTFPPTLLSSNKLMDEFNDIPIDNRETLDTTFNEDDSCFLNSTSHSNVRSVNDLIASLSHRLREIKIICTRFEIDFDHLNAFEDSCHSGLDISKIEYEDENAPPNFIDIDTQEEIKESSAPSFGTVQAIQPSSSTAAAASNFGTMRTFSHAEGKESESPSRGTVRGITPTASTAAGTPSSGTVKTIKRGKSSAKAPVKNTTSISTEPVATTSKSDPSSKSESPSRGTVRGITPAASKAAGTPRPIKREKSSAKAPIQNSTSISTETVAKSDSESILAAQIKKVNNMMALNQFNSLRDEIGLIAKVDSFSMDAANFFRFGGENSFCSATVTVMMHSIRLYLLTLNIKQCPRSLKSRLCYYASMNLTEFRDLISRIGREDNAKFIAFNVGDVPLEAERPFQSAVNHINSTIASGFSRSCIKLRLPRKNSLDNTFAFGQLHIDFNERLEELNKTDADQSIIFIDIAQPDRSGSRTSTINFPISMRRDSLSVTYQTAGAIYWLPSASGDRSYHVHIVTRSRNRLDSIRYSGFEYNIDGTVLSGVSKSRNIDFPSIKKFNNQSYFLKGVIMFLNLLSTAKTKSKLSFSIPEDEVLRVESASGEICYSNITSLLAYTATKKSVACWLDGSTINEVLTSFAAFLGDERNVALDSNALHEIIKSFPDSKEIDDTQYDRMKDMFGESYKNVFAIQDSFIHIPINQPERSHWNFALILTGIKTIIVHDPMYSESRVASIGECLFSFVKREAGDDVTLMTNWQIKTSIKHPQQSDTVNCGVFTLISSIRAMCLVKQNRIGELLKPWNFPATADDIMDYRKSFAKIVLNDDREVEFANFVNMFSLT